MNDQATNQNGRRRRDVDDFSIKLSTIRIWMHEKDIGKLTRILWAGQGNRLRQQASTNPRVKRFLAAVPYVMNAIKEVHQAVIENNLETLQAKLEPPVPQALITGKDANGLNIIHKAAGLGHSKMLEYLISQWPEGANETDMTGKTALHWAASCKNNMRCYTLLTQAGCDEEAVDYKSKTPTYYRHKPNEIERAFLVYVPEAPRVSPDVATDWDALNADNSNDNKKPDTKIPLTNGLNRRSIDDSNENSSEVDLNDGLSANDEDETKTNDELKEPVENSVETTPDTNEADENVEENENDENLEENNSKDENNEEDKNAYDLNETAVGEAQEGCETNETFETQADGIEDEKQQEKEEEEEVEKEAVVNGNEEIKQENGHGDQEERNEMEEQAKDNAEAENQESVKIDDKEEHENKPEIGEEADLINHNDVIEGKENQSVDGEVDNDKAIDVKNKEKEDDNNNQANEYNENDEEAVPDDNESEKTDDENNINEAESNNEAVSCDEGNNDDDIPAHLQDEYEKRKADKILKQDQETGERTCEVKPVVAETNLDGAQKQNSDSVDEDDDEVQFGKL